MARHEMRGMRGHVIHFDSTGRFTLPRMPHTRFISGLLIFYTANVARYTVSIPHDIRDSGDALFKYSVS